MPDTPQKQVPVRAGVFDREDFWHPETALRGSRCGPFREALDLLANRRVQVTDLVDGSLPLGRAEKALRCSAEPGKMKIQLIG